MYEDETGEVPQRFFGDSLEEYHGPNICEWPGGDEGGEIPQRFSDDSLKEDSPNICDCVDNSQFAQPCACSSIDILEENQESVVCFCEDAEQSCECLSSQRWIYYMSEKVKYIIDIEWNLSCPYSLRFVKLENEENTDNYYFEAMFSKATKMYPIPQVTVSVFFKFERSVSQCEEPVKVFYFLESSHQLHDPEHVLLSPISLVYVMKAKLSLFKFLESIRLDE